MTETVSPAGVLMDVLDLMEKPAFVAELASAVRPDGIRPPLWQVRYELEHAKKVADPAPWLSELEHSISHVMAAPSHDALRKALLQHAALTAAWIRDLDGREA